MKRVLCVDDGSLIAYQMILGKRYEVIGERSGEGALDWLGKNSADLILINRLGYGDMHEVETIKRIRQMGVTIPIILRSSTVGFIGDAAKEAGANECISCFDIRDCLPVLERYLGD